MKNTGSKILILGVVIAIAVAGVLVFYPTIVAPPIDVPVENLHKASLDNDIAGRKATKALQTILSDNYEVVDDPPQYGKDVNDFLCKRLGIKDKTERSFAR